MAAQTLNSDVGLPPNSYIYRIISTATRQDPLAYSKTDQLAVISSDDSLRFLDSASLKVNGVVKNVNDSVTCLERANDAPSNIVATAGRDGLIRYWDQRSRQKVLEIQSPNKLISSLVCNAQNNFVAAGIENPEDGAHESPVYVWDQRNVSGPLRSFIDSHTDTVTSLQLHPTLPTLLLSSSTDGLVNIFDTSQADEDDALYQVVNHGSAIAHAGFMYPSTDIYALGTDETMSFYALQSQKEEEEEPAPKVFGDVREPLGCEYLAKMHWGRVDLVPVRKGAGVLQYDYDLTKSVRLPGAHGEEVVRDLFTDTHTQTTYTVGEDSHVRAWKTDISTAETMDVDEGVDAKKEKKDRKERRKEKKDKKEKKRMRMAGNSGPICITYAKKPGTEVNIHIDTSSWTLCIPVVLVGFWLCLAPTANAQGRPDRRGKTPYSYVDPLIGTINGGHVFPGATLPFGMAKAGADILGDENQGGYASNTAPISGFSHMHDSGTGGSASLGNFPIFPQAGCPNDDIKACNYTMWGRATPRRQGSVIAQPGYFDITLESHIRAEMTATNHTALYKFTFPENPVTENTTLNPLILVEISDLPQTRTEANVTVDPETGRITGGGQFSPSFGTGNYQSYFCLDFSGAEIKDAGTWTNSRPSNKVRSLKVGTRNDTPVGGWVQFDKPRVANQILARVGMSFISEEQACANAEREVPTKDFNSYVDAAREAWEEKLSVISLKDGGVSQGLLKAFWSGVYRTMISPQDYTGENPFWNDGEPYYDSYYCIWDSFRSVHPLLTILDPHSQTLMVRSLLSIYKHTGYLPDCRMSLCKGLTQGGSNADVLIVDAYLKNITAGIDWAIAYEAIVKDAEVEPENWNVEGRGGLASWKSLGYIPTESLQARGEGMRTRSISRTVEYAYDDFAISTLARALGHEEDAAKYLNRSGNWKNMYNPAQRSFVNGVDTGFQGFLQPRYMDGMFGVQEPIYCSPLLSPSGCFLNEAGRETYEAPVWLYTLYAPGDMKSLISTLGGTDSFIKRLDWLHESGVLYLGNEPSFLALFLYHYAGRPGKSAGRAHQYIPSQFNDTISGIPGNDDSGAMGSFQALVMMGLFPNAGQDVYLILPPFFEEVCVKSQQTGNTATIRNVNFDAAYKNIYIQSATLNGVAYTKNWITHSFFLEGGVLELTLGPEESAWGTKPEDLPPSLGPFAV
ncbi:hypothetical protein OPT61_g6734 [Boeremia exigua]|uniref:Uncharacterized protein n=1 Tax=Boeremia exigua TaxID=749465 RepID=A0ACC2I612_9PLEO|nr:hypothetical protein OPT61_g6734 [Boeremia exigua]